jgi:hypothetical protein
MMFYIYKTARSHLGLPGSIGFSRAKSLAGFFINPARFQPWISRVLSRPAWPSQVLKHCFT